MTGRIPSDTLYPDASYSNVAVSSGMRTDLDTMLHPLFPDAGEEAGFETCIGAYKVRVYSAVPGARIATPSDRKILNLLAGRIGETIRSGQEPSRHIALDVREIVDALSGDAVVGGSEYQRITERLNRLLATRVVTNAPLGGDVERERNFGWIDAFEQDVQQIPGERKVLRVKISLSEDAFRWITRAEGFDLPQEEYHAITSSKSSVWRIYEICLAQVLRSDDHVAHISLDELRMRVPISSELKVFKARTLKSAMAAISASPEMRRNVTVCLVRKTDSGFEPVSGRAPLDSLYIRATAGAGPLPRVSQLIPGGSAQNDSALAREVVMSS